MVSIHFYDNWYHFCLLGKRRLSHRLADECERSSSSCISALFSYINLIPALHHFNFQSFSHFLPCVYIYMYVGDSQLLYAHTVYRALLNTFLVVDTWGSIQLHKNYATSVQTPFWTHPVRRASGLSNIHYLLATSTSSLYSTPLVNYTMLYHHHHAVHAVCEMSFNQKTKYKNSSPKVNRNIVKAKLYTQKFCYYNTSLALSLSLSFCTNMGRYMQHSLAVSECAEQISIKLNVNNLNYIETYAHTHTLLLFCFFCLCFFLFRHN